MNAKEGKNMDFSRLLDAYCSKETINEFKKKFQENSVSSFLVNPKYHFDGILNQEGIRKDQNDPLLFRFDKEKNRLGKSLEHFAGAYYILDPSSARISYYLKDLVSIDPIVLDMCAAPGGKSIAFSFRRPDSLIISNDISYTRALEIVKNTDRLGLTNILTMSMDPMEIRSKLDASFDLIILDAPCSGSGMIRKEPKMADDWSMEKVRRLLPVQENLLKKAYDLVKKNGIICYSTCSLSIEEDEDQVKKFLKEHPDMEEVKVALKDEGIIEGEFGYHMIPGVFDGEGIYFSILKKKEGEARTLKPYHYKEKSPVKDLNAIAYKKNIFLLNRFYPEFESLPFIVRGTKLYDSSEHPKCLYDHSCSKILDLPVLELERDDAIRYVKGEELKIRSQEKDGLMIAGYQGLRLGFGKKVKDRFKNYLPKGLKSEVF